MYDMEVFTESGEFFGTVEEVIISQSRINSWKVVSTKDSMLSRLLKNAKGVIVPHNLVKAVGDIIIISDSAFSSSKQEKD